MDIFESFFWFIVIFIIIWTSNNIDRNKYV